MFIVFGFLKLDKPRIMLNPGTVESLAGLHIAIDVLLYTSKYELKDRITSPQLKKLINNKSIAILPFNDDKTAFIFGISPYVQKHLDGYVWANNVWQSYNSYVLQQHAGHETTSRLLASGFNLNKINDPEYPSAKFSNDDKHIAL